MSRHELLVGQHTSHEPYSARRPSNVAGIAPAVGLASGVRQMCRMECRPCVCDVDYVAETIGA